MLWHAVSNNGPPVCCSHIHTHFVCTHEAADVETKYECPMPLQTDNWRDFDEYETMLNLFDDLRKISY